MGIKIEDALKVLFEKNPKFLVIGFVSDRIRGIPPTYNLESNAVPDKESLYDICDKFKIFRVFNVGEEIPSEEIVKEKTHKNVTDIEAKDKKEFERLKNKYQW